MKKPIVTIIVLLFLVGLLGPKLVGIVLEQRIEVILESINKRSEYLAKVEKTDRRWFSTQSEISIKGIHPELPLDINIALNAQHGPLILSDGVSLAWLMLELNTITPNLSEQIKLLDSEVIYKVNALTGLLGTTSYTDRLSALSYYTPEGVLTFSGMQGQGKFNSNKLNYTSQLASFKADVNNEVTLVIEDIKFDISLMASIEEIMEQGFYDSHSTFSVKLIEYANQIDGAQTRIDDITMTSSSVYNKTTDLGDANLALDISTIFTEQNTFSDIQTLVEMKALKGSLLRAYKTLSDEINQSPKNIDFINKKVEVFAETELLPQLKIEPEFNIKQFSGKINGSPINALMTAKLLGVEKLPENLAEPSFWLQHTNLNGNVNMDKKAARFVIKQILQDQLNGNPEFLALSQNEQNDLLNQQIGPTLLALEKEKMIVIDDQKVEVMFTLLNGVATLNGSPIPLATN